MTEPTPSQTESTQSKREKYAFLKAEAAAPYKGLRQFIYIVFGASGAIGGFVFLIQALAGRDVESALPNLALQVGVVALMVWLFRLEGRKKRQ
ncbi:DUF3493 domain-containing protein [Pantanalinema sp. GBBB05]|uniref:DUF3493 domain-containing protein n=1 Tax=Pantanalinema sp. GBBB05 TaxID=2604139 RepID=UPI001D9DA2C4|nr:DUF3493 domain-containing protein [Pantanalinema sp. GBBB05]